MPLPTRVVIVGGGHAAAQLCATLPELNPKPDVHLVSSEAELPYQRPPLSKVFLKDSTAPLQTIRSQHWYEENGIQVTLGIRAVSIDRVRRELVLADGSRIYYDFLVLATGAVPKTLDAFPETLSNVFVLRTAQDAQQLREALNGAHKLAVIGGGFIGLEVAATAKALGKSVTVVEAGTRLLGRSVSAHLAEHVLQTHRNAGVEVELGASNLTCEVVNEKVGGLSFSAKQLAIDLVLLGVGADPDTSLAKLAELDCENGIRVDAAMRTSDPHILAIGDCANFPLPSGIRRRLESIQNANDQARTAAATISGSTQAYAALPWFWSEQGGLRLQMAGVFETADLSVRRNSAQAGSFSLLHYLQGKLVCVESVNAPQDHLWAKKLLEANKSPDPQAVQNSDTALKEFL